MKKKLVVLTLAAAMAMSAVACGSNADTADQGNQDAAADNGTDAAADDSAAADDTAAADTGSTANKDKPLVWFNRQPSNSSTGELDSTALNFNKDTDFRGRDGTSGCDHADGERRGIYPLKGHPAGKARL